MIDATTQGEPTEVVTAIDRVLDSDNETKDARQRLDAVSVTLKSVLDEVADVAKNFDRWGPSAWMAGVGTVMIGVAIAFQLMALSVRGDDRRLPSGELSLVVIIGAVLLALACVYRFSVANRRARWANERVQRLEDEERLERHALREAEERSHQLRRQAIATLGERADEAHRDAAGRDGGKYD